MVSRGSALETTTRTQPFNHQRILLFVVGRVDRGASKSELFADFRRLAPAEIMEELENLVHLGALYLEEAGPGGFAKAADFGGTSRYRMTDRGKRIAAGPTGAELTIEEIV